jgi:Flp pilus assembly protein CpaB
VRSSSPFRSLRPLRRMPVLWWAGVIGLAVAIGSVVTLSVSHARGTAERYGSVVNVVVATSNTEASTPLEAPNFTVESRPRSFVPDAALGALDSEAMTLSNITKGEVVTANDVNPDGLGELAAHLSGDERAVTVPATESSIALEVGDHVDVIGAFGGEEGAEFGAMVLSQSARVIGVDQRSATLAVYQGDAPRVAMAAKDQRAAVAVAPSPPG